MTRRARGCIVALAVAALGSSGIAAMPVDAGAATTSPDELSDRYGLLRERDLPVGYEIDSARRETGSLAGYFTVEGDCDRINTRAQFLGEEPVTSRATFEEAATTGRVGGQGVETVYAFEDEDDAKEYYKTFSSAFGEIVDCGTFLDGSGNIGTYAALSVGKVGDQRTALSFDPRADRYTRVGLARDDEVVIYLELYDDDASDAQFAALLKQAEKRSR